MLDVVPAQRALHATMHAHTQIEEEGASRWITNETTLPVPPGIVLVARVAKKTIPPNRLALLAKTLRTQ